MSVQDILLQQAMQDSQNQPDPAVAMGVSGAGGALLGAAAMTPVHMGGNALRGVADKALGKKMAQGLTGRSFRPGFRMAGGLGGLILGGALGAGAANAMRTSSPAGEMLATIQAQGGELSAMQQMQLQKILADTYNNMGL